MCNNCKNCIHDRVCGHKEKYEQYIKEFNELNEKWDLFQKNPSCPEYLNKSLLKVNHGNYFNTESLEDKNTENTYYNCEKVKSDLNNSIERAEKLYNKNINKDIPPTIDLNELIEKILLVNTLRNRKNSGVRY
jgi:hypothetical protein